MCMVCGKSTSEEGQREVTGQTAHGANEVDPTEGTRRFHDGKWYYFTNESNNLIYFLYISVLEDFGS